MMCPGHTFICRDKTRIRHRAVTPHIMRRRHNWAAALPCGTCTGSHIKSTTVAQVIFEGVTLSYNDVNLSVSIRKLLNFQNGSRDSSIGIATRLQVGTPGFDSLQEQDFSLL
jgi:hypothetical protein